MHTWRALFERGAAVDVGVDDVRAALGRVRTTDADASAEPEPDAEPGDASARDVAPPAESSPARVVADADVLAADLLVDADARRALDHLRAHSWTTLLASDPLLEDAEAVVAALATPALAGDWRARLDAWRDPVSHPPGDHPALATAYRGGAMHLLSFDDDLLSAKAGAALGSRLSVSARPPAAFASLFAPASLYREVVGGEYPGPDRDPRE
ncbi:MAG: hypothetical protein ABEK02_08310 [Haloquadratum sp.]